MEKQYSTPADWVGQERLGFVINAAFDQQNNALITDWLGKLSNQLPEGLYPMTPQGLHITVLDWVAPLFDYAGADKRELFGSLRETYEPAFRAITDSMEPFDIQFNEVRVTPGTIILVGQDGGQFQSLRDKFMATVELPEGGKQPPTIVHSSLARFIAPAIELSPIEAFVAANPLTLTQHIEDFRLVETRREPMQDYSVIETFKLNSQKTT